jgi:predicted MFS family arabinose efflux permease
MLDNNKTNQITNKNARFKVLLMAFSLLIIIMSFTGFVNYMTFADNYNNSLASTYSVAGNELVRKIEYALLYGKPIENYYGMNETLNELKEVIPEVGEVNIVSPDGTLMYDLSGFVRDRRLPDDLLKAAAFQQGTLNENLSYQFYENNTYVFIKIKDSTAQHVASLAMVFPEGTFLHANFEAAFSQFSSSFSKQLVGYLLGIVLLAMLLLFLIFLKTTVYNEANSLNTKKILIIFIAVLGSAQLMYSGVNYYLFKNAYVDMAYTSKNFIENTIEKNVTGVYAKGLSLQNIEGFDAYLDSIKDSIAQIEDITYEINPANSEQISRFNALISNDYINQQMSKILLDMLTVLIISIFFMIELTLLAVVIMTRGPTSASRQLETDIDITSSHRLVRALVFFISLSTFMSLTFVPIVMKNIYQPFLGLPRDVVLGLPLSAEMLGGILAIILAGRSINKSSWQQVFYLGAVFLAVGNLLSGLSDTVIAYTLSRAVAGWGSGYILITIRTLAVSLPDRTVAIAEFSAGSIAGLNCGAVIGGMLADRIGYSAVFCIAAVTVAFSVFFVYRLMPGYTIEAKGTGSSSLMANLVNLITDKKAMVFLACIFIPYFVAGAFLDYYFPLFASSNNLSQSDISRGILLNGLFVIYLGPVLSRFFSDRLGNTSGMVVSVFIVVCALGTFIMFGNIPAAFVTIILLGIADSFGVAMKTNYFLGLNGIKNLQLNQGIAVFSGMVNLSRMAGPILYGMALSLGMRMGVGIIALVIFVLLLVFVFVTKVTSEKSDAFTVGS